MKEKNSLTIKTSSAFQSNFKIIEFDVFRSEINSFNLLVEVNVQVWKKKQLKAWCNNVHLFSIFNPTETCRCSGFARRRFQCVGFFSPAVLFCLCLCTSIVFTSRYQMCVFVCATSFFFTSPILSSSVSPPYISWFSVACLCICVRHRGVSPRNQNSFF